MDKWLMRLPTNSIEESSFLLSSQGGIDAMFCVGRDEDVPANVYAGAGTFLERDDRQAIEEVVQDLFALCRGLLGDAVADLRSKA